MLRAIDLTVPSGTIAAVVGANGAGKTTLLRALSGMIRPAAGQVLLAGEDLRARRWSSWCVAAWRTCRRGA
ncbi:ATP-binding cassette domain-containing protein [Micromonospora sp. M12]